MITVVTGTLAGQPVTLAWEDGKLSGTPPALAMVLEATGAKRAAQWPSVEEPDVTQQLDFIVTALNLLDDAAVHGDLPAVEPLPEGAIE